MKIKPLFRYFLIIVLALQAALAGPASAQAPVPAAPVVVKPLELPAEAVDLPQATGRVMDAFVQDLTQHTQGLEARQADVAVCFDAYKTTANEARSVAVPAYYECIATAAANTKAIWIGAATTFRTFATSLSGVGKQLDEIKRYLGGQEQQISGQLRGLQTGIVEGRSKLQLVQAALARGQKLNADQTREVRHLIDDLMTAHLKAQLLKQQHAFFEQTGQRLVSYASQLGDLSGEIGVLEHQANNRTEVWAAILEAIRSQAAISVMDANFAQLRLGLEKLGPMLEAIRRLQNIELPALPGAGEAPVAQLQLPSANLGELLAAVLKQTQ